VTRALAAVVAGAALTAVMTWPIVVRPGSVGRVNTNDGRFSIWNVAWVAHALTDESAGLFDANIFHPHRGTLAYSEANLVAGVMAVPVYAATRDPVAAHNAVVLAALVLAFVATWALVRRLTGSGLAGLLSGTGFAFCTYVSAHTAHIQLLMVFVIPLTLLQLHRYVEHPATRRGVELGLVLALAGLACGYYGIFSGLAAGLALLWFAPGQPNALRYWRGVLVAVVVGAAAVAPAVRPYVELRRETGFKSVPDIEGARMYSADLAAYLRSGTVVHQAILPLYPATLQRDIRRDGEVLFPGFVIVVLAIVGAAAAWRTAPTTGREPPVPSPAGSSRRIVALYAVLTLLAIWVSLGPAGGLYTWLAESVPMMSFLRAPARAGTIALFGLTVLAGVGAAQLVSRRAGRGLVAALVLLTAAELKAHWPLADVPPVPTVYRYLATLPPGPVVELHFPYRRNDEHQHARYMLWSAWHWRPLVNGYSDFIPPDFYEIAVPINYFPDPESFRIMKARHVRYVIVHLDAYDEGPIRESMIARFPPYAEYLRLLADEDGKRLYEIARWPE
jgi:hypothetical protein